MPIRRDMWVLDGCRTCCVAPKRGVRMRYSAAARSHHLHFQGQVQGADAYLTRDGVYTIAGVFRWQHGTNISLKEVDIRLRFNVRLFTPLHFRRRACAWCDELLRDGDDIVPYANDPEAHRACALRQVLGSVAHIEQRCGCFIPGSEARDDPALTRRQAAEAAVQAYEQWCQGVSADIERELDERRYDV
jgi:hypothetical protein